MNINDKIDEIRDLIFINVELPLNMFSIIPDEAWIDVYEWAKSKSPEFLTKLHYDVLKEIYDRQINLF
jgi:hypothetical protein